MHCCEKNSTILIPMDSLFQIESFDAFETAVQEVLKNLYYSKHPLTIQIDPVEFEKAKQEVKEIIYNCDFDINKIAEFMNGKTWEKNKIAYFLKLLEKHKTEVLCAALNHYNSHSGDTLEHFDWVLKLVMGTSELKILNYSLLQLTLSILNSSGECTNIVYDVNKDVLLKMIHCLENFENIGK